MMKFTENFIQLFAQCVAMISVLAENRLMAEDIFRNVPKECRETFEQNAMIILKYFRKFGGLK